MPTLSQGDVPFLFFWLFFLSFVFVFYVCCDSIAAVQATFECVNFEFRRGTTILSDKKSKWITAAAWSQEFKGLTAENEAAFEMCSIPLVSCVQFKSDAGGAAWTRCSSPCCLHCHVCNRFVFSRFRPKTTCSACFFCFHSSWNNSVIRMIHRQCFFCSMYTPDSLSRFIISCRRVSALFCSGVKFQLEISLLYFWTAWRRGRDSQWITLLLCRLNVMFFFVFFSI